jgi:hypothetical protein
VITFHVDISEEIHEVRGELGTLATSLLLGKQMPVRKRGVIKLEAAQCLNEQNKDFVNNGGF